MDREERKLFFLATKVYKGDTLSDMLIYFQALDRVNRAESGMFIAVIYSDRILSKLRLAGADSNFGFAAINNDGNALLKTDEINLDIDMNKMSDRNGEYKTGQHSVLYLKSDFVDLKYVSLFSERGIRGNVDYVTGIFLLIFFLAIVASIILAGINTKRINKPIWTMLDENENLIENLRTQVLVDLLYNVQSDETEQAQLFAKYHINFDMKKICVIVVGVSKSDDLEFNIYLDAINLALRETSGIISSVGGTLNVRNYMVRANVSDEVYILNYNDSDILGAVLNKALQVFKEKL